MVDELAFDVLTFDTQEMGFNNPSWTWSELEAALSGRRRRDGRAAGTPSWNAGGDGPAWGRKPPAVRGHRHPRSPGAVPYAELHCHSNFSFLDGASHPEELATEAARLGLEALALTDHNGFYGVVRFAEAARAVGIPTVFGTEITLTPGLADHQRVVRGEADTLFQVNTGRAPRLPTPPTRPAVTSCCSPTDQPDTAASPRTLSLGHLAGEKGAPQFTLADVADATWPACVGAHRLPQGGGAVGARRRRPVGRRAASSSGWSRRSAATACWSSCGTTATRSTRPATTPSPRSPTASGVECIATNNVHYATPSQRKLATADRRRAGPPQPRRARPVAAGRRRGAPALRRRAGPPLRPLPGRRRAGRRDRPGGGVRPRRSSRPTCRRSRAPRSDGRAADRRCSTCARLTEEGGRRTYGERPAPHEDLSLARQGVVARSTTSSTSSSTSGFPGYFLVVWDLVEFCRRNDIFCQGRGSAANSAVCYALGITKADAVSLGLLFERFLSTRARRPARHRHRHRERSPGGGDPVRLRAPRPPPHGPGRQRDHLPGPLGGARHGQGARPLRRPAGRLVEAGRRLGWRGRPPPTSPTAPSRSRAGPGVARSRTRRATSASTPAGW